MLSENTPSCDRHYGVFEYEALRSSVVGGAQTQEVTAFSLSAFYAYGMAAWTRQAENMDARVEEQDFDVTPNPPERSEALTTLLANLIDF